MSDIGNDFVGNSLDLLGPDQSNHCEVAKSGCGAAEQEKSILKTAGVKSKIARGGVEYRVRRGFSIPDRLCGIRFPYPISCQATVVLQLENPVRIIERSGPLQERHWLENLHGNVSRIPNGTWLGNVMAHVVVRVG